MVGSEWGKLLLKIDTLEERIVYLENQLPPVRYTGDGFGPEIAVTKREQELVHLMFTVALTTADFAWNRTGEPRRTQITDWVRKILRDLGFNVSDPVGMSWGELREGAKYLEQPREGVQIVSAVRPD